MIVDVGVVLLLFLFTLFLLLLLFLLSMVLLELFYQGGARPALQSYRFDSIEIICDNNQYSA